jgi:Inner membrane component of T3SS, cytoplasmic domain
VTAMRDGPRMRSAASVPPGATVQPPFSGSPSAPPAAPITPSAPALETNRTGSYQAPGGTRSGAEGKRLKLPDWEHLSLACIAGPDAGKIFEIDRPRVVIGRANADILLADSECSRQHAAIEVSEDKTMLIDLGSTNGTYVGERHIQEFQLENRSEFDVGVSTLMFIRSRKD